MNELKKIKIILKNYDKLKDKDKFIQIIKKEITHILYLNQNNTKSNDNFIHSLQSYNEKYSQNIKNNILSINSDFEEMDKLDEKIEILKKKTIEIDNFVIPELTNLNQDLDHKKIFNNSKTNNQNSLKIKNLLRLISKAKNEKKNIELSVSKNITKINNIKNNYYNIDIDIVQKKNLKFLEQTNINLKNKILGLKNEIENFDCQISLLKKNKKQTNSILRNNKYQIDNAIIEKKKMIMEKNELLKEVSLLNDKKKEFEQNQIKIKPKIIAKNKLFENYIKKNNYELNRILNIKNYDFDDNLINKLKNIDWDCNNVILITKLKYIFLPKFKLKKILNAIIFINKLKCYI